MTYGVVVALPGLAPLQIGRHRDDGVYIGEELRVRVEVT